MKCLTPGAPLCPGRTNKRDKLLVIICLIPLLLFLPRQLFGQDDGPAQQPFLLNVLSSSRTEINPTYQFMPSSDTHEAWLHLARTIPMGIGRSSLSLQSRISLLHGSLGLRVRKGSDEEVRWSAGLLNGDIYRAPVAFGVTVLNYDRLGLYRMEARWFGLRLGPAVRWETGWGAAEPRLVGSIGGSSLQPGPVNFSDLGDAADHTVHGFDAGYEIELPARLDYWFLISVAGGQRVLVGDRNLYVTHGQVEAQTIVLPQLQLYARYQLDRVRMSGQSDTARSVRLGLRVWL